MPRNEVQKSVVRSWSATPKEIRMLDAVAKYHGLSKSGAIRALIRKEFWRIFPAGTKEVPPEKGARIAGGDDD
jgi:hypothetical protein